MSVKPAEKEQASFDSYFEYLYLRIYEFLYLTGIRFIRQIRGAYHYLSGKVIYMAEGIREFLLHTGRQIYTSAKNFFTGKYHAFMSYSNRAANAFGHLDQKLC